MTSDPRFREPSQKALDFIASSQDRTRGGWLYLPGRGSDISVSAWMTVGLKTGELAGLEVPQATYAGVGKLLDTAKKSDEEPYLFRYDPFAPDTPTQRHGRLATDSMTAAGMLMRLYTSWDAKDANFAKGAAVLRKKLPELGTALNPKRDTYYWYYATQVMFHAGGDSWADWQQRLGPILTKSQIIRGPTIGSWNPTTPIPDRWGRHAGRLYVTAMNVLSLEVEYRHLPITNSGR